MSIKRPTEFDNQAYLNDINSSASFLKKRISGLEDNIPEFLIVLGSGLGGLSKEIELEDEIAYDDIEGFPKFRGVQGHAGRLLYGTLEGKKVFMMAGRYHYYEYADMIPSLAMKLITFPTRVFQTLGVPNMIVSNAAGCVNENFKIGELMMIKDHINLMGSNPLLGPNIDKLGLRFPSMKGAYNPDMIKLANDIASRNGININEGIYLAIAGPNYETDAEYTMVDSMKADAVGMSTAPEVLAARHSHGNVMNVAGITVVTNLGGPKVQIPPSHGEVMDAANKAMPAAITVVKGLVRERPIK